MSPVLLARLVLVSLSGLSIISLSADAVLYANGDVRLNRNGSICINNTLGVLEVYINGEWGTVCSGGFNTGSAAAVCRQLGFLDSLSYGLPSKYNLQTPAVPSVLADVQCPVGIDYTASGYLHILRCPHSTSSINSCNNNNNNNDDVIAIQCNEVLITSSPYIGQIRLVNGPIQSTGLLEIYLHNEWGTVCGEEFNKGAADSACRQLGYTESLNYTITPNSMTSPVWIDDITCTESESCFSTNCVNDDQSKVTAGPCAGHAMDVSISCTFVSTDGDTLLSGNEFICRIHGVDVLVIVLSSIFGFFFLTCLCVLITCIICCYTVSTCPLYAYKQKKKYQGLI